MLDNLALFLRIVEKGGLSAAGRDLGLSPTTVSERLAALEQHYGATLLTRTTRAISLTDEGRLLVDGARRLLSEADELETSIRLGIDKVSGPIRLSAPSDLGRSRIAPLIDDFLIANPEVSVDLTLSDGYVDVVKQGLDFAIRIGDLPDSALIVRKLAENRRVVCAAPAYLSNRGTPIHPDDLVHHNCLTMRFGQTVAREWSFIVKGKACVVAVNGDRVADDGGLVRNWCLAGHGIALKSIWDVESDFASGALVELLPTFSSGATQLQIVYPSKQTMPRRVRMLTRYLEAHFQRAAVLDE